RLHGPPRARHGLRRGDRTPPPQRGGGGGRSWPPPSPPRPRGGEGARPRGRGCPGGAAGGRAGGGPRDATPGPAAPPPPSGRPAGRIERLARRRGQPPHRPQPGNGGWCGLLGVFVLLMVLRGCPENATTPSRQAPLDLSTAPRPAFHPGAMDAPELREELLE